jgi:hypothetical protein
MSAKEALTPPRPAIHVVDSYRLSDLALMNIHYDQAV